MLAIDINDDKTLYAARVWRTQVLKEQAAWVAAKTLRAFVPEGFHVKIDEVDVEVPGHPELPRYKYVGTMCSIDPAGSGLHFSCWAYTREGVVAKLLAHIIDGGGFFPLT